MFKQFFLENPIPRREFSKSKHICSFEDKSNVPCMKISGLICRKCIYCKLIPK